MMSLSGSWRLAILLGGLAFLSLAVIAVLAQGQAAYAATITVTTVDDELNGDGDCSLREAIQAANTDLPVDACTAGSGPDTIVVPAGVYVLNIPPDGTPNDNWDGDLDVLGDLTINGAGAGVGGTIINGNVDRVFHIDPFGLGGLTVEISGLTIASGSTAGSGGGMYSAGTLTLNDSEVSGNTASGKGGGIYTSGELTLNNSEVSGNTAGSTGGGLYSYYTTLTLNSSAINGNTAGGGGGIYSHYATLTLSSTDVSGNEASGGGGGISTYRGTLTLDDGAVSGNSATAGDGGGIYARSTTIGTLTGLTVSNNSASGSAGGMYSNREVTLDDCTVTGNEAGSSGGGIYGYGTFTNCTISGNTAGSSGGGIYTSATLILNSTTINGNTATAGDGGGLYNGGTSTFTNSTISSNLAGANGGGIYVKSAGTLTLESSTVSDNSAVDGGGIFNPASATLKNTIVANSTSGADCSGVITSDGHNLIEDPTGCTIIADITGNIIGLDPDLGPLANNGGPTQTHALLSGSPAIDAGSDDCPPPATDQRGVARPQGASCDIGAYEYEGPIPEKLGDVNCDGLVNVVDALFVLQYEVGMRVGSGGCPLPPPPPDTLNVANCDVSDDGLCNVVDALFILQCEVGIPNTFCPAEVQAAQHEVSSRQSFNREVAYDEP